MPSDINIPLALLDNNNIELDSKYIQVTFKQTIILLSPTKYRNKRSSLNLQSSQFLDRSKLFILNKLCPSLLTNI